MDQVTLTTEKMDELLRFLPVFEDPDRVYVKGWGGGEPTYTGPSTLSADTASVTEIKGAGDFEAVLTWAVGLRATVPFNVRTLDGPPRLLIDFRH